MINWRKPLGFTILKLIGSEVPKNLASIERMAQLSPEGVNNEQLLRLAQLLKAVKDNVPYYNSYLEAYSHKEIDEDPIKILNKLPILSKEILQQNFEELKSTSSIGRKTYQNQSGGSTGAPTIFIQDNHYSDWNIANSIYFRTFAGVQPGDKEIRFWGSEKDLVESKRNFKLKFRNWIYNRQDLDVFSLSEKRILKYIGHLKKKKPKWIEGYSHALLEMAQFITQNKIVLPKINGVLSTAGTLNDEMREIVEKAFNTRVFNRYGSREAGGIACNCNKNEGLHLVPWNHYVELLDENLKPVLPGKSGKIYLTTLNNFSMPLLRYDMGDYAVASEKKYCSCKRSMPLIKHIEGREINMFKTKNGKSISAFFFIHFIGVVHNNGSIGKFQIIQHDYEELEIKLIVLSDQDFSDSKSKIESSIKKLMGEECQIRWTFVNDIPNLPNGKYLYAINKM